MLNKKEIAKIKTAQTKLLRTENVFIPKRKTQLIEKYAKNKGMKVINLKLHKPRDLKGRFINMWLLIKGKI